MSDSTFYWLLFFFGIYAIGSAIGTAAKAAGSAAKTVGGAAMRNPGSTVRGGIKLWEIFHK